MYAYIFKYTYEHAYIHIIYTYEHTFIYINIHGCMDINLIEHNLFNYNIIIIDAYTYILAQKCALCCINMTC